MQKVRYELDPYNRLVAVGSGTKSGLSRFRKALDGQFKLDENNNLFYHIKAPLEEGARIPHQINLKGEWSLTDNHELRFTLNKLGREMLGDQITLQGQILDVNENSLLFAITTTTKENTRSTYALDLEGSWKADENNRLSFRVKREKGAYDILTFTGVWEINKNNQIIYQYEKAELLRKKGKTHTLLFKGYWDIKEKARISYALSGDTDSAFNFTAAAGIFKEDYIKFETGIVLKRRRKPVVRTIKLFGRWNLKKDMGLVFEVEYESGKIKEIVFGADARLTDKDTVSFSLRDEIENKDLGAELKLSHEILKGDGEAFLRALTSRRETAIYAGAAWRW
jgi:hypothetical protein